MLDDYFLFFFKQKTVYEMRISDWSSDVCSSDLLAHQYRQLGTLPPAVGEQCMGPRERLDAPADGGDEFVGARRLRQLHHRVDDGEQVPGAVIDLAREQLQIGRAHV